MNWIISYMFCILSLTKFSIPSEIQLKIKLFDYISSSRKFNNNQNSNNESFPKFKICLSTIKENRCDLIIEETKYFNEILKIPEVFDKRIVLKKVPNLLIIHVVVETKSIKANQTNFNEFTITEINPKISVWKTGFLTPKVDIHKSQLQYKFMFQCQNGYYGANCENSCINSSSEICVEENCKLNCVEGTCQLNKQKNITHCKCSNGWYGVNCSQRIKNCQTINCNSINLICEESGYCSCDDKTMKEKIICSQNTKNRGQLMKHSHYNGKVDIVYILTITTVVIGILGFIGFISITITRFYKDRKSKKLNTVFYQNSYDDIASLDSNKSERKLEIIEEEDE